MRSNAGRKASSRPYAIGPPHANVAEPLDATQLAFLKDTADRIRSYLDDGQIGTTQRLLLQDKLDELTSAIADHESRPTLEHHGAQP